MPHINMKHFPSLSVQQQAALAEAFTHAVTNIVQCDAGVVSIAFEPIEKESWHETVYVPEIINRKKWLYKMPNY